MVKASTSDEYKEWAQISTAIRISRQTRRITLEEVASLTGISTSTLSQIESAKRNCTIMTLLRITNALGVSLDVVPKEKSQRIRFVP